MLIYAVYLRDGGGERLDSCYRLRANADRRASQLNTIRPRARVAPLHLED